MIKGNHTNLDIKELASLNGSWMTSLTDNEVGPVDSCIFDAVLSVSIDRHHD
jgi:hypothetical protein